MKTLLRFGSVTKSYGSKVVFQNFEGEVNGSNVIGLVGDNGAGKSTLLRILAGLEQPDSGRFQSFAGNVGVAYLPQELAHDQVDIVRSYVRNGLQALVSLERQMREVEATMATASGDRLDAAVASYGRLTGEFERLQGWELDARVEKALNDVGLPEEMWDQPLNRLSGGQKTRVALARTVVSAPDLLLLDEPTNYLDLAGLQWLETWVKRQEGAVIVVSHDRYFLDQVASHIWEIEREQLRSYIGNYTAYRAQKELAVQQQREQYEHDQAEKKKLRELIAKQLQWFHNAHNAATADKLESAKTKVFYRARAAKNARRAKATVSRLERKLGESVEKPWERDRLGISFSATDFASQSLLAAEELVFGYCDLPLFERASFQLRPGERVAIVGENGTGKTTILKLLLGELEPQGGRLSRSPSLSVGYFSQEREDLVLDNSLLDEMMKIEGLSRSEAWLILARMGFRDQEVHKRLSDLSVGQRARISLAKLLVSPYNVLVLDEPTNHLDIHSREKIEEALNDYPGALVLVSHDRYFLDLAVNQVYHLSNRRLTRYLGNYSYFVEQHNRDAIAEERARQETILRTRMAELAARLSRTKHDSLEYCELDREYKEVAAKLRRVSPAATRQKDGSPKPC